MTEYIDVDVRPILRAGGEPFSVIMAALERLEAGTGAAPLCDLQTDPAVRRHGGQGFRTLRAAARGRRVGGSVHAGRTKPAEQLSAAASASGFDNWPEPAVTLDNRDLDPPEPMVRILAAADKLGPGETLSALLRREPVFLFPQLEKRGFRWLGGFTPDGATYELTVRAPS